MPANCANEREWGKEDSEEWHTGYTDDTEWGTFFSTKHTKHTKGRGRERETCGVADMKRVFLRGVPRLGVKALSKLTVAPKGAVGPR